MTKERLRFDPRLTIFEMEKGKDTLVEEHSVDGKEYYECYYLNTKVLLAYLQAPTTKVVEKSIYMVDMIIEKN